MHASLQHAVELCRADPVLDALLPGDVGAVAVTECDIDGTRVHFATDMERDPIQRAHRAGTFFEPAELQLMRRHLPPGGTFIDIGANVGNHSIFAGLFSDAARILPFEPNPLAYRLLVLNVVMNGLHDRVLFDHVGYGASDVAATGFAMTERHKNLGAARMVAGAGDISTLRPDDVLRDETPDFIKIDVEGMEMQVLRGLQKTIARVRPVLLVEVDRDNIHDFADWRLAHGYQLPVSIKHYAENRNFLCIPAERVADIAATKRATESAAKLVSGRHAAAAKTAARKGGDG